MPTTVLEGTKIEDIDLVGLFPASEGMISQIYGRIGNGKTYMATRMVLDDLANGQVVYTNWDIHYDGFDSRTSFWHVLKGLLMPWSNTFYKYPKENLKSIKIDENFIDTFETLTDCKVYLDEGHVVFDSYEMARMSLQKRKAILHTRHFDRSIVIISQRPTAVHVSMRANVNIFYKIEKLMTWPVLWFRVSEFQDIKGETVDEEEPVSKKWRFGSKAVNRAYNSKYMRYGREPSQFLAVEGYILSYPERLRAMWRVLRDSVPFRRRTPLLDTEGGYADEEAAGGLDI